VILAALLGCGNTPEAPAPGDADAPDTAAPGDTGVSPDVAEVGRVDGGGGSDVVDGGGGSSDVVDASSPVDLPSAEDARADAPPPVDGPVEGCSTPRATLTLPGTVMPIRASTRKSSRVGGSSCQTRATGPGDFYELIITARTMVTVSTDNVGTGLDTILSIRRSCSDLSSEVACNNNSVGSRRFRASLLRTLLEPGTYSLLVEGFDGAAGEYVLTATSNPPAANALCSTPTALGAINLGEQDIARGGPISTSCLPGGGGQLFYTATVLPNTRASFRVTPTDTMAGWGPRIRVLSDCGATTCLTIGEAAAGNAATASLANPTTMPRTVVLAVSASQVTATGTFEIAQTNTMLAANASCASPMPLTPAGLTGLNLADGAVPATGCLTGGSGTRFYTVSVPARTLATVRMVPTGMRITGNLLIRALESCASTSCVGVGSNSGNQPAVLTFANTAATPRDFVLAANASAPSATGTYDLTLATQPIAPGGACQLPIELTAGTRRMGESTAEGGPPSALCEFGNGPQRWYRVTIPAGQRLSTTVSSANTSRRAVLRYIDSCEATGCILSTRGILGLPSGLTLNNATMAPRTLSVSVSSDSTTLPLNFDLETALAPVVPTSSCDAAVSLATDGVAVTGDTTRGLYRVTRCGIGDLGLEVFYTVQLPPLRRVTVRAQPAAGGTWRPRVRAFTECASFSCFDSATTTTDGGAAVLVLDNPSQLPRTMVVSVSPTTQGPGGAFSLSATAAALPMPTESFYSLAMIPAACDEVSAGTTVAPMAGWTEDWASEITPLPFPLRFFGADATHVSVSSNGFAQLWTSMAGTPLSPAVSSTLPSAGPPNNLLAAFWDDLAPQSEAAMTTVRTAALGTAPNRRFVIAWNNWRFFAGPAGERLDFQAKLFESTGVIEYHYCNLTGPTPRAGGSGATIGAEDAQGVRGILVAQDAPGVVATGRAFRLLPP
jgi:hypothetical protein